LRIEIEIEIENDKRRRYALTKVDRFCQFELELEFELDISAFFATLQFLRAYGMTNNGSELKIFDKRPRTNDKGLEN